MMRKESIMAKFSDNFLIGAATAAHQVEGNNTNSDYWAMEQMENTSFAEPSLDAVDHYNHYEEDIKLLADAGCNAYRFSMEWARIEPKQGEFDPAEIEHYRRVLLCCRANGITPVVTMHHFSSPKWLIEQGGWEAESTVDAFAAYCKYVAEQLGDLFDYVCTINEANMGLQLAAISARYLRQLSTGTADASEKLEGSVQVGVNIDAMVARMQAQKEENVKVFGTDTPQIFVSGRTAEGDLLVMRAHQAARTAMKAVKPGFRIGITLSLHDIQVTEGGAEHAKREWEHEFFHYVPYIKEDDFFGLQNYTRSVYGADGICPNPEGAELTQMGYEFYPEALEHVIRQVYGELGIPILVTENGIATADDDRRITFIDRATDGIVRCVTDEIPILGYMHWSLLDNFEWQKGYSMTFGLIAVDRSTQKRTPKKSLAYLGSLREQ